MSSQFSSYTKDELEKKLKKQKMFTIIQAVVVVLMVVFSIFSTIENGVSFQTFLPLFFAPMLFVMQMEAIKIKEEINSRK